MLDAPVLLKAEYRRENYCPKNRSDRNQGSPLAGDCRAQQRTPSPGARSLCSGLAVGASGCVIDPSFGCVGTNKHWWLLTLSLLCLAALFPASLQASSPRSTTLPLLLSRHSEPAYFIRARISPQRQITTSWQHWTALN